MNTKNKEVVTVTNNSEIKIDQSVISVFNESLKIGDLNKATQLLSQNPSLVIFVPISGGAY